MDARDAIEKVRRLKTEAEAQLAVDVQRALNALEWRTGLSAKAVAVDMGDVTNVCDCEQRYTVLGVRIDLGRI